MFGSADDQLYRQTSKQNALRKARQEVLLPYLTELAETD
jgi:hypothetical protein